MNATALCTLAALTLLAGVAEARPLLPRRAVVVAPAPAVAVTRRIVLEYEARQAAQLDRIAAGMRSGALTPGEADRLMRRQAKLERRLQRSLHDRILTRTEMRKLDRAFAKASVEIRKYETNARVSLRATAHAAPRGVVVPRTPRRMVVPEVRHVHRVRPGVSVRASFAL